MCIRDSDTRTEIKIQAAFARMMEGRTSFIVAHRLSTIREADVILVMKDGQMCIRDSTYTAKGHMVAIVSDGTAVLGLGDIGPKAAIPVMEGKAVLFKKFADVDAVPICLDTKDPEEIIRTVDVYKRQALCRNIHSNVYLSPSSPITRAYIQESRISPAL